LFPIAGKAQYLPAALRQFRAAAALAAVRGEDKRLIKALVHRLDECPGSHVGHFHPRRGFADGAGFRDEFQQVRLARAEGDFLSANDAETRVQSRQSGRTGFSFHNAVAGVGDGRLAHTCKGNFNFRGWQTPLCSKKWRWSAGLPSLAAMLDFPA
jgi:hypothetical protein